MIIISVGGGLGNQMFEYALYYKLKKLYPDQVIKLDIYYAFPEAHNGFEVEKIFNLQSEKASKEEVERLIDRLLVGEHESRICSLIREVRQRIGLKKKSYLLQRDYSAYYPEFFNLDRNQSYYLYGSFCNSLYFHDMKQEIQQLFTFPTLDEKIENGERSLIKILAYRFIYEGVIMYHGIWGFVQKSIINMLFRIFVRS